MKRFDTIDALKEFLRKDRECVSQSPIRFINVESMKMWVEVKQYLLLLSKREVDLSSFCAKKDTTPNLRRFKIDLSNTEENVCALPLSEYLRVEPKKAKGMIADLLSREYKGNEKGKLRIYIPMYRMKSVFLAMSDTDPRREKCVLLLETGEDPDYSLTIVQEGLKVEGIGNNIVGFKAYLQYWEQNPDKPLVLHTENAVYLGAQVFFDNVRVIVTAFDLLATYYSLPAECKSEDGPIEYWQSLASIASKERSFEAACCEALNVNRWTERAFERWSDKDAFSKWLLWLWTKTKSPTGYLGACIAESSTVDTFVTSLFCKITSFLNDSRFAAYYAERKTLLQSIEVPPPAAFWDAVEALPLLARLQVLTDLSEKERSMAFGALKEVPETDRAKALDILQSTYPALAHYLRCAADPFVEDMTEDIADYFAKYRWYKAANILPKSFIDRVKALACEKGEKVYALKARNSIVTEEYDDHTAMIFADGMGFEYVNYLYAVLSQLQNEGYQVRIRIGHCNLPTITKCNKDFLIGKRVAEELLEPDEMKHGKEAYPRTIEKELAFLDTLKEKVRSAFDAGVHRVILTTDHGTSRMAVLVRATEFDHKIDPKGHVIYKYGRYCEGVDMADELESTIEDGNKLIFADYQRFDQKGAPIDETHGGASLEEWIVPIFIIDKAASGKERPVFHIQAPKGELRPDAGTKAVTVEFGLDGYAGSDVSVRIHGEKILCKAAGAMYAFSYQPGRGEKTVSVKVFAGTSSAGEFTFSVKQGIAAKKGFDI